MRISRPQIVNSRPSLRHTASWRETKVECGVGSGTSCRGRNRRGNTPRRSRTSRRTARAGEEWSRGAWNVATGSSRDWTLGTPPAEGRSYPACHRSAHSGCLHSADRNNGQWTVSRLVLGGSVAEWLACWTQCRRAWFQIAAATLSGNSLGQTVHTHRASVRQAVKLVAALLRVAGVPAGLAESNGSLLPGL